MFGNTATKKEEQFQEALKEFRLQTFQDPEDRETIVRMARFLSNANLLKMSMLFNSSPTDKAEVNYLSVLVEQNFFMMRQLEAISKLLENQK